MYSMAERRMLINSESKTYIRVADVYGVVPSITGKIELVYEGEQEGSSNVAYFLIGKAIRKEFLKMFPDPEKVKKLKKENPYSKITHWFGDGNHLDITQEMSTKDYEKALLSVPGLKDLVNKNFPGQAKEEEMILMEFVLHGLVEYSQLSKHRLDGGIQFKDLMSSMFNMGGHNDEEDDEDNA